MEERGKLAVFLEFSEVVDARKASAMARRKKSEMKVSFIDRIVEFRLLVSDDLMVGLRLKEQ